MINKSEFNKIREEMHKFDLKREQVIQLSREIITVSKQIIYAAQRNDLKEAEAAVKNIKDKVNKLKKVNIITDTNIHSVAFQEYVEAVAFYDYVKNKKIPTKQSLGVSAEDYLCGLCDLTGELVRKAMTKDAMALRFFFVYSCPSWCSVPNTFVFSRIAKTTVKTSRKGKTTSNSPIWEKKSITPLKGVTAGIGVAVTGGKVAIRFLVGFMYLNVSFLW